jgi:hypothetical protein
VRLHGVHADHLFTRQRIVVAIGPAPIRKMPGEHWFLAETGRGPPKKSGCCFCYGRWAIVTFVRRTVVQSS